MSGLVREIGLMSGWGIAACLLLVGATGLALGYFLRCPWTMVLAAVLAGLLSVVAHEQRWFGRAVEIPALLSPAVALLVAAVLARRRRWLPTIALVLAVAGIASAAAGTVAGLRYTEEGIAEERRTGARGPWDEEMVLDLRRYGEEIAWTNATVPSRLWPALLLVVAAFLLRRERSAPRAMLLEGGLFAVCGVAAVVWWDHRHGLWSTPHRPLRVEAGAAFAAPLPEIEVDAGETAWLDAIGGLVPADGSVLVFRSVDALLREGGLGRFFATPVGSAGLAPLSERWGFDPTDSGALKEFGLATDRPIILAVAPDGDVSAAPAGERRDPARQAPVRLFRRWWARRGADPCRRLARPATRRLQDHQLYPAPQG